MLKLTSTNYFDKGTKALSNSKIKDFATCPRYFYNKHITCTIQDEEKDAFIFGGIVDRLLSGEEFSKHYEVADGIRTAKRKAEAQDKGVHLLSKTEYDEILNVSIAVEETEAFKHIKQNAVMQDILQIPMEINEHFDSLAGRPDFWWKNGEICYIVDLKTSTTVDPKKYFYQATGFHYDQQLAMYKLLLGKLHPEIKHFLCYNLVVAKQKNIYGVELFQYPAEIITQAENKLVELIDKISHEKEYKKYNPTFDNPAIFGQFDGQEEYGEWED